jgi:hypothetical protein
MSFLPITDEIIATLNCGIWFPALATALLMPDACGAVDSPDIKPSARWISWFDEYVLPQYGSDTQFKFDGEVFYKFRNSAIHENTGYARGAYGYDRVVFVIPNKSGAMLDRCCQTNIIDGESTTLLTMDLERFVKIICAGVKVWENGFSTDDVRKERLEKLIRLHPNGISSFIVGLPLVA